MAPPQQQPPKTLYNADNDDEEDYGFTTKKKPLSKLPMPVIAPP
jgi:hypothetical protein